MTKGTLVLKQFFDYSQEANLEKVCYEGTDTTRGGWSF